MIIRTYNPIERGQPAIWLLGSIERGACARTMRQVREYPAGGPLDIVVDSSGGSCGEGLRLYTALREIPRQKRVTILRAASMAAIVAMVGDVIRIATHGSIFLHPPGWRREALVEAVASLHLTSDDLRSAAGRLDDTDELHLDIVERRTGLTRTTLRALSAADTTLDAAEAVQLGFADEVVRCS